MTAAEIEAIAGGYHGDAFRILGPHSVRAKDGQPRWEVRAFLPQAEAAWVSLDGEPRRYTLIARLAGGREVELEDPYRFGPQISDTDLYLYGEGTLHEAYRTLGAHLA